MTRQRIVSVSIATFLFIAALFWIMHGSAQTRGVSQPSDATTMRQAFVLTSPVIKNGGELPREFTGDGEGATPPLEWANAPLGTKSFALIMHHIAPDKTKWYWIMYNIPPETMSLAKNIKNLGVLGNNSTNGKIDYLPPHSKGPGPKTYIVTLYALSSPLKISDAPADVGRDTLMAAMKNLILAEAQIQFVYTRPGNGRPEEGQHENPPSSPNL